jgi:hypothetical protein
MQHTVSEKDMLLSMFRPLTPPFVQEKHRSSPNPLVQTPPAEESGEEDDIEPIEKPLKKRRRMHMEKDSHNMEKPNKENSEYVEPTHLHHPPTLKPMITRSLPIPMRAWYNPVILSLLAYSPVFGLFIMGQLTIHVMLMTVFLFVATQFYLSYQQDLYFFFSFLTQSLFWTSYIDHMWTMPIVSLIYIGWLNFCWFYVLGTYKPSEYISYLGDSDMIHVMWNLQLGSMMYLLYSSSSV